MRRMICMIMLSVLMITGTAYAGTYESDISEIMLTLSLNDSSCKSAPQQEANGAYRMVDMLKVIATILD